MNVSFFLLLIVLFGLAFVTNWDFHVIMMLVLSTVFWAAMIWYVPSSYVTTVSGTNNISSPIQVRDRDAKGRRPARQHAT